MSPNGHGRYLCCHLVSRHSLQADPPSSPSRRPKWRPGGPASGRRAACSGPCIGVSEIALGQSGTQGVDIGCRRRAPFPGWRPACFSHRRRCAGRRVGPAWLDYFDVHVISVGVCGAFPPPVFRDGLRSLPPCVSARVCRLGSSASPPDPEVSSPKLCHGRES